MDNQSMWESRYRDEAGHNPDGVRPHPIVLEQAQAVLKRNRQEGALSEPMHAADLGSGSGRHALALAELGLAVTAVDFAPSAHDLLQREAVAQGISDRINPVVADVSSWRPTDREVFDIVVAIYLHIDLSVLLDSAGLLAPGGRLVWVAHAPDSPHGPPLAVLRDSLDDFRAKLALLDQSQFRCLQLEERQLSSEFIDIVAIVERLPVDHAPTSN